MSATTSMTMPVPSWLRAFTALFRREIGIFTATPLAGIFLIAFWLAHGFCAFYLAGLLESGNLDLSAVFAFHPWLWLFFAPALAQRLFPEERRAGTLEVLLSFPVPLSALLCAKYAAALLLALLALAGTFPLWLTLAYLGQPDHGVIFASYWGSVMLLAAMLALSTACAVAARSQVSAFTLGVMLCFAYLLAGFPLFLDALDETIPTALLEGVAGFGFLPHFESFTKGLVGLRAFMILLLHTGFWLAVGLVLLHGASRKM